MKVAALRAADGVPEPIVRMLRRLIRRTRWLIGLRGICATIAAAIGALLLVMAIDASVTLYSLSTRWLLSLAAYGVTAVAALWFLARPLAHSFTLAGIARAIEVRHPELQERLSSAVELLTSEDAPELRGSDQLIAALVEQATDNVQSIQPRREISLAAAKPFLLAAAAVLAILAGLFALWPDTTAFLLTRASAPFLNRPNLLGRDLDVTPGDVVRHEGERLEVQVTVPRRSVRRATLLSQAADSAEQEQRMTLITPGEAERRFAFTTPPLAASFDYRVEAGDALSQFYHVDVVPRPAVERIDVRYDYPTYARRKPKTVQDSDGTIRALRGTVVTLTIHTNKPVSEAELIINDQPAPAKQLEKPEDEPAVAFRFTLAPELAGRWSLRLTDEHDYTSPTTEYPIELVPDNPPAVAVVRPEEKRLRLPPTARLPLQYTAEDDVGIARADLLVGIDGQRQPPRPVTLPETEGQPLQAHAGEAVLPLAKLDLRGAKYVTVQFRATDALPKAFGGPQHGLSELYRIDLDIRAPSFEVAQLIATEKQIKEQLKKAQKDLKKAKDEAKRLKRDLPKAEEPTRNDNQRVDRMREKLADADAAARRAAEVMRQSHYEGLAERAQELADEHIAKAENVAGQIKLADEPRERGILAKETERTIDRSLEEVQQLLDELEPATDFVRKALEAEELAERQADLTRERLAMDQAAEQAADQADAAEQGMAEEQWQQAQDALAQDLAEQMQENPGAPRAAMEMDQQAAAQAAQDARQMAQEQQGLAEENRRLDRLQEIDQALGDLARQQGELAQDAAGQEAAQDQAEPMGQAAEDIQAGQLGAAVQKQAAAEAALEEQAQALAGQQEGQPGAEQAAEGQAPQPGQEGQAPAGEQTPAGAEQPAQAGEAGQQPGQMAQQAEGAQPGQPQGAEAAQAAEQVGDLARRQGELRQQTEALQAERDQLIAKHTQDQRGRLQAEQGHIAQEAQGLAEQVGQAAPQPDQLQNQAAGAAQEAAEALEAGQMGDAAQQAAQAGEQLGQLAERLAEAAAQPFAPERQPAGEQGQPAGEQDMPAGEQGMPAGEQGMPAGEQGQPAGEQGMPAGEQGMPAGEQGAPAGEQGMPAGEQGMPAGEQGMPGAEQGQPAGGQPGNPQEAAELAQEAGALAERQQAVAQEMQELAQGNALGQAAAQQQALAERAGDLAAAAQQMQERAEQWGLGQEAQAAQQAAGNLGEAQQQAAQAAGQLAEAAGQMAQGQGQPAQGQPAEGQQEQQGQTPGQAQGAPEGGQPAAGQPAGGQPAPPSQAQGAQQAGAQAMNQAAQALEGLAQGLGQAASQAAPAAPGQPATAAQQMASAQNAAGQAAQNQSAMAAAQAAGQLGQMAAAAAQQTQAMGGNMQQSQPQAQAQGDPKEGTGAQSTDLSQARLRELGISLDNWARLPGELRDQILQAAQQAGPAEYRPLIKRYFQEIARRGRRSPAKK
jgi:hypothetical protein